MGEDSQTPTPKKYEQLDNSIGSNKREYKSDRRKSNEIEKIEVLGGSRKSGEIMTSVIRQIN